MTKEEKELRRVIRESVRASEEHFASWPYYSERITALVRAVAADCARHIETDGRGKCVTDEAAKGLANEIRDRWGVR
jgi:hypothetical protein